MSLLARLSALPLWIVVVAPACSAGDTPPIAPNDPFLACSGAARDPKQATAARSLVESLADARVMVSPFTDETATARFGASSPAIGKLWEVTIEVKTLQPDTHVVIKPPRFTRDCVEQSVGWSAMWADMIASIYPDPPVAPVVDQKLPTVPPLYGAEPAPDKIPKGESPLWAKLEEATGKARSNKKAYKLTVKDKLAWDTMEEAKRGAAQKAHQVAQAERDKRMREIAAQKAASEAERAKVEAARAKVSEAALPVCTHPQSVTADEIVFVSPARCTYVSIPSAASVVKPGKTCGTPVTLAIDAQWIVEHEGQPCMLDASVQRTFKKEGAAAELLPDLFAKGPLSLHDLRATK